MAQSTRDLLNIPKQSMTRYQSVRELYEISRGRREEWGIGGYQAPKTTQYFKKSYHFPKEKRTDDYTKALKRKDWPDPTKHSPDYKAELDREWLNKGGKIPKGQKTTVIDQVMKESKKFPGPCEYFKDPLPKKKVVPPANESKREKDHFLSTVEALSSEIPCSWKYDPYLKKENKHQVSLWGKPKKPEPVKKVDVGPGCYEKYILAKNFTLPCPNKFTVPKAKSVETHGKTTAAGIAYNFPGPGKYSEAYNISSMAEIIKKKNKQGKSAGSKTKRYLDDLIRLTKGIPGPGAYNVGPPEDDNKKKLS
ncbi:hypothetical protein SteCoe_12045 [Stentor coeruleus]|uniref:Uncharacterized protein n=1 Tax=Stentor coeruleus TaxID=5963 RepID=A0A1R2CBS2_9CILI|nr:hypothetical protein SteCoe_12045 [Stentor coeruleus]